MKYKITAILAFFFLTNAAFAQVISLAGDWQFAIDRQDKGVAEKWYLKAMAETVRLPGTMAGNGKGDDISLKTEWTGTIYDSSFYFRPSLAKYRTTDNLKIPFWLTPAKHYVGTAWYNKTFSLPKSSQGKHIRLYLERVHTQSTVWVDGQLIGKGNSLSTAHVFDVGKLSAGNHILSISVDNRIDKMNVGPDSHSVSDHTQGNWNGITGNLYLEVLPDLQLENIEVHPDVANKVANVTVYLINKGNKKQKATMDINAVSLNSAIVHKTAVISVEVTVMPGDTLKTHLKLPMGLNMLLWDEFTPNLYRLTATLTPRQGVVQLRKAQFGMRDFKIKGTQFLINGSPVFLRGTLHNAEFPLEGYPSTDTIAWEKILTTAKQYGFNHIRFHSWCPPEAAFQAADKLGFYLQVEAPTWPNHGTTVGDGNFIDRYIYDETNRIVKAYGNYASFCMLSSGNEPAGSKQVGYLTGFVKYWKEKDNRRVYTGASVGMSWPLVPSNEYMVKSGPRGLKWMDTHPESVTDYHDAIKDFNVPYVTHEMGQWCVFPDFDEIKEYTGVYKPRNFEMFRENLADHGMAHQAHDFFMASGKLQALCYKAEIEKDLRTKGLAGFQLLGLQDFPGQGTALVGVLNALWEPKDYINSKEYSSFCNTTVPLAQFPKFIFTNDETFEAKVEVFHYGTTDLPAADFKWLVQDVEGKTIGSGSFSPGTIARGGLTDIGKVTLPLSGFKMPKKLKLLVYNIALRISNDWDFWVYPAGIALPANTGIYYCTAIDAKAEAVLAKGGTVFLNAAGKVIKGKEIIMHFTPVFWNTSWFKMRPPHVTGMLIQEKHPALAAFPTNYHSDYQWWGIVRNAQVMHLEDFPQGFTPIVQPIDTWFMNRKLALIFEAKVGKGKLMVSSADLSPSNTDVASKQLYYSLIQYMGSKQFNPVGDVSFTVIKGLFTTPSKEVWDGYTKDNPDELKPVKHGVD